MTYGQQTSFRLMAEHYAISKAALTGDEVALAALVSLAATTGYADGMSAAANTLGLPL